mmetsp:Transcript_30277/g.39050  ORF Transcript_30277/g.39050 Transcript_30277/m.39050 type:complete len:108 (-) Transcript_30277:155-478(-)
MYIYNCRSSFDLFVLNVNLVRSMCVYYCHPFLLMTIEQDGATTILGTDLAKELKDNHFKGLVVIRSANSSSSDFDQYMSTGVVDFCVGKSESHKDLAERIQARYMVR